MEASALRHPAVAGINPRTPLLRLQSDERLVAMTRRGSHGAFEALVARYQARLLAFCRHMLGSREDAEDVLQEVFAAAFNAMLADERPINVRPWLYRIARNRSLNHLRRHQAVGVDTLDHHEAEHGITTAEKVHRREEFRQLIADVQELPETQKTALLLREIDALSYDQIAEAMETTVPSVKSLLVRARVSLAEAAEARHLSCDDVRLELAEVAEGLRKSSAPARRHVRGCERCAAFRKQLRQTNRALAAVLPVGPLLLLKKSLLAHLGTHAAATGGGAAAGGAAGAAVQAGAAGLASKAAASLAAAAIVTAGAVEVKHVAVDRPAAERAAQVAAAPAPRTAAPGTSSEAPVPVAAAPQPVAPGPAAAATREEPRERRRAARRKAQATATPAPTATPVATPVPTPVATATPVATPAATATPAPVVATPPEPTPAPTQHDGDTTVLPPVATPTPAAPPAAAAPVAGPAPEAHATPAPTPDVTAEPVALEARPQGR